MKRFGIRVTLPAGDVMSAAHLLGESWEMLRWYDTEVERDAALAHMLNPPDYYRKGDRATQVLTKVERE